MASTQVDLPQNLWRSEKMKYIQLLISPDAIHACLDEIGRMGIFHFRDMNPTVNAARRQFISAVKRCSEIQRKLRFFDDQVKKANMPVQAEAGDNFDLNELETQFDEQERELKQMNSHEEALNKHQNELVEMRLVLQMASQFFDKAAQGTTEDLMALQTEEEQRGGEMMPYQQAAPGTTSSALRLGFIAGVIPRDRIDTFHRILFMALRGNCFLQQAEIPDPLVDPTTNEPVNKSVFVVFFSGAHAQGKITKICESFGANLYPFPEAPAQRRDMLEQVEGRLTTLRTVIDRTKDLRQRLLRTVAVHLEAWTQFVAKEKAIYMTMNLFSMDASARCLIGEGWCPKLDVPRLEAALARGQERSRATVPPISTTLHKPATPPTYFRTNKFTDVFQSIVDAYGTATYREVNPALFSIITFPFLFAMMFGDFAHGIILLLFSLMMVLMEKKFLAKKDLNEMFAILFEGRYMLLLMSIFSVYVGLLYNETFSLSINFFGSHYIRHIVGDFAHYEFAGTPYPFGMDPIWRECANQNMMVNSLKMKMAVVVGVTQMLVGIVFKCFNAIHFGHWYDVWFEFIPQFVLMFVLFGYLVIIIFIKWWTVYSTPPQLIRTMIYMFLNFGGEIDEPVFPGQRPIQMALVVIAVICIPMMLIPKPFILRAQHKRGYHEIEGGKRHRPNPEAEEFNFSEEFVKQLIETIEFVLGTISNTASYLRLWALSLAHGELAKVFWMYGVLFVAAEVPAPLNYIAPALGVVIWLGATVGILMCMESLSAFLHALRLHWVEFQNKFYKAEGYPFMPLNFAKLQQEEEQ
ncbi:hypothetical protein PAPYR_10425 [Paratrimastix pyriformis]|uniref:V-type proton ATPase subunit a n=1 Tax=Paratrimastix pyriformis TaxID=342808 RepID=A0ABQ8U8U1_9EUKA|nr:hypothetical protein PAPYR_10425 [Paratrimastix pyriformis]